MMYRCKYSGVKANNNEMTREMCDLTTVILSKLSLRVIKEETVMSIIYTLSQS